VVRPIEGKAAKRAGFSVMPVAYSLGQARLEVFVYTDQAALDRDISRMDTLLVVPKGTTSTWESVPTLIRSANLAAVLLTDSPRQAERVALALTAGAPQPGSPR
jgi:hypothetical protein